MNISYIKKILKDTDYIRMGGTAEELKAARYLKDCCIELGADAHLEAFPVQMAKIKKAKLYIDGAEVACKGFFNCGSGIVEAPFAYIPGNDPVSLKKAKNCIVLTDSYLGTFVYEDLYKNGAKGIITYDGNVNFRDRDIDQRELRKQVLKGEYEKLLCVNINAKDAVEIVKGNPKTAKIEIEQDEYEGESRNVVAFVPGERPEEIVFTAHYDSTSLSRGSYDNMTGCIGLLGIMEGLIKGGMTKYSLRFVFCGSEERGLLGSKAYVSEFKDELENVVLNINLDMIGTIMGKFISCVSAEERLQSYIDYFAAEKGFGISTRCGVYSSDSTPFADNGVPAVSFARIAGGNLAPIHNRYDTSAVLSPARIKEDIEFITAFSARMANAEVFPVSREMPESIKNQLDEYMARKRKKN